MNPQRERLPIIVNYYCPKNIFGTRVFGGVHESSIRSTTLDGCPCPILAQPTPSDSPSDKNLEFSTATCRSFSCLNVVSVSLSLSLNLNLKIPTCGESNTPSLEFRVDPIRPLCTFSTRVWSLPSSIHLTLRKTPLLVTLNVVPGKIHAPPTAQKDSPVMEEYQILIVWINTSSTLKDKYTECLSRYENNVPATMDFNTR